MAEKTQMSRHDSRKTVFSLLFSKEFFPELDSREFLQDNSENTEVPFNTYVVSTFLGTVNNLDTIDAELEKSSVKWKVSRMARVTRSILRLAVYELLLVENPIPPKAVINEAVELAKEFDDDAAPAFINGILNKIARDHGKIGAAEEQADETI
ncbi:MAG: transcription antitermination factor NusB [Clostridia bacterium]|nr:transcription antitermination factor NusB [Clostridia bacterium]